MGTNVSYQQIMAGVLYRGGKTAGLGAMPRQGGKKIVLARPDRKAAFAKIVAQNKDVR